jgi:hypothetical protein
MKYILMQQDCKGKCKRWIAKIQKYDLLIYSRNLVKGNRMEKLIASSNCEDLGVNYVVVNKEVVYFGKIDDSDKFKHSE